MMLFLISGFLALMLQVQAQQEMDSAVKLAAEATFQVPRAQTDTSVVAPRSSACPPSAAGCAAVNGLPTRCRFAWQTFEGSMSLGQGPEDNFDHPSTTDPQHHSSPFISFAQRPLCVASVGTSTPAAQTLPGWPQAADVQCNIDFDNRHKTECDATATLHFDKTPLAWAIFWTPTVHAHAEALAPPFRQ